MSTRLYVGNLSFNTTEQSLEALFSNYAQVEDVAIITDRDTGRSRGFGFVTMGDDGAKEAIEALNGTELEGRTLTVNEAKPREDRRGGGGGGGGGGGFRGRGGGRGGGGGGGGGRDRW
ncbi:MAG: RNA recognition motif domain-containing protein [Phycisphaeraceae bacterium]